MRILSILFLILSSIYTFSFIKVCWKDNEKLSAIGSILIVVLGWGISMIALFRT